MAAWGQTQDLATTDDGSKLFFSSTLRLKGTAEYENAKIFQYTNGSFSLVAQTIPTVTLPDGSTFQFALHMPSVTGDAGILAYDGTASCSGGPSCPGAWPVGGYISGAQLPVNMTYWGSLRISHNGRYAIRFGGVPGNVPPYVSFFDLQTRLADYQVQCGGSLSGCTMPGDGRQSVADDGTIVTTQGLWRGGQYLPLKLSHSPLLARISADGSTVVYDAAVMGMCYGDLAFGVCNFNHVLYAYGIAAGIEVPLAQGPNYLENARGQQTPYFLPSLSANGRFVLYRAPDPKTGLPQVFLSATDKSSKRQLTTAPEGIAESVLSGDSHHAFAVTQAGALLSIGVDAETAETILPGNLSPFGNPAGPVVPGSLVTFAGSDLLDSAGRSRITVNSIPAPAVSSAPGYVTVQIPWETPLDVFASLAVANPESPFEQVVATVKPSAASPQILAIFHANFSPLGSGNAVSPGELLAFYMTGLGPVTPPVSTGQAAPISPLSTLALPLGCTWDRGTTSEQPAKILFAGLAPGTIGVYQVNLYAPDGPAQHSLACTSRLSDGSIASAALVSFTVQ